MTSSASCAYPLVKRWSALVGLSVPTTARPRSALRGRRSQWHLPLDEDELRRWEHTRRVVASRSLGHHDPDRPLSPRFPRSFIGDVSQKRTHVHAYRLGEKNDA